MENAIFVKDACFYVKDGQVAVSFDEENAILADRAVYDGKNTLLLAGVDNKVFAVQNIVPEVRSILKNAGEVMVILEKDNEIAGAYELPLEYNEKLDFEDNFVSEAKDFCEFVTELAIS